MRQTLKRSSIHLSTILILVIAALPSVQAIAGEGTASEQSATRSYRLDNGPTLIVR